MTEENGEEKYEIDVNLNGDSIRVSGNDPDWVEEQFDDKLEEVISEQEEDEQHFHMGAGAGWLMAEASGESPDEAFGLWLDMWEQIIEDTGELTERQRQQAGLTR